jgi:phage/plasmid-associated DNA primase
MTITEDEANKIAKNKLRKQPKASTSDKNIILSEHRLTFYPGAIHIMEVLKEKYNLKTIPQAGTDREPIYYYNGQIYERAEEFLRTAAHDEFISQWVEMKETAQITNDKAMTSKLEIKLDRGPTSAEIQEVLDMVRRTTFYHARINPPTHIPFLNGLLNLKTKKLDDFDPDFFFTYQVDASLVDQHITLNDVPLFKSLLNTAFSPVEISVILSYFGYALYPGFPAHKVLFMVGRERIGKGTLVRVLQGLMKNGSGSISLARLLTSERFQFTGIENKNLLVDAEVKRKFRRGTILDFTAFNNMYGGDTLSIEPKGHEAHDYISNSKAIFLGNLPFIKIDDPPAISRILIAQTKNERPLKVIKNLDKLILETEKDKIATLLVNILFHLIYTDFNFPRQFSDDKTAEILAELADSVEFFIDDQTEYSEGSQVKVDDAYNAFVSWCNSKGIPHVARQTFVKKFGTTYPKRLLGARGHRFYVFTNCILFSDDNKNNDNDGSNPGKSDLNKKTGGEKNEENPGDENAGDNQSNNSSDSPKETSSNDKNDSQKDNNELSNSKILEIKNRIIDVIKQGTPSNELPNIQRLIKSDYDLDAEATANIIKSLISEKAASLDSYKKHLLANPNTPGLSSLEQDNNNGKQEPETDDGKKDEKTDNDDAGDNPSGNSPDSDKSAGNEANKNEENGKQEAIDNSDIIYRKSQALATDISISDVFQRSGYNYYALDKSKNDIKGKAWQSYILKSQEITRKEFETMRGDSQ